MLLLPDLTKTYIKTCTPLVVSNKYTSNTNNQEQPRSRFILLQDSTELQNLWLISSHKKLNSKLQRGHSIKSAKYQMWVLLKPHRTKALDSMMKQPTQGLLRFPQWTDPTHITTPS